MWRTRGRVALSRQMALIYTTPVLRLLGKLQGIPASGYDSCSRAACTDRLFAACALSLRVHKRQATVTSGLQGLGALARQRCAAPGVTCRALQETTRASFLKTGELQCAPTQRCAAQRQHAHVQVDDQLTNSRLPQLCSLCSCCLFAASHRPDPCPRCGNDSCNAPEEHHNTAVQDLAASGCLATLLRHCSTQHPRPMAALSVAAKAGTNTLAMGCEAYRRRASKQFAPRRAAPQAGASCRYTACQVSVA